MRTARVGVGVKQVVSREIKVRENHKLTGHEEQCSVHNIRIAYRSNHNIMTSFERTCNAWDIMLFYHYYSIPALHSTVCHSYWVVPLNRDATWTNASSTNGISHAAWVSCELVFHWVHSPGAWGIQKNALMFLWHHPYIFMHLESWWETNQLQLILGCDLICTWPVQSQGLQPFLSLSLRSPRMGQIV